MSGGSDSSSILDRVLALVPLLVFEASHIRNSCVFLSFLAVLALCALFRSLSFSRQPSEAKIETPELSNKYYLFALLILSWFSFSFICHICHICVKLTQGQQYDDIRKTGHLSIRSTSCNRSA